MRVCGTPRLWDLSARQGPGNALDQLPVSRSTARCGPGDRPLLPASGGSLPPASSLVHEGPEMLGQMMDKVTSSARIIQVPAGPTVRHEPPKVKKMSQN